MLTWSEFVDARPDMAHLAADLLYPFDVGLGFLATTRPDGGPRVHPICPLLTDEGIFGFIVPGPKLSDLRRDGRYALHSETLPPPRQDDALYITGGVRRPTRVDLRARLTEQFVSERAWLTEPESGFEEHELVEFLIDSCLLTLTEPSDGLPAGHTIWHARQRA